GGGEEPAVVEVDDRAIVVETALDLAPVVLVAGEVAGRRPTGLLVCAGRARQRVLAERGHDQPGADTTQEGASRTHDPPPIDEARRVVGTPGPSPRQGDGTAPARVRPPDQYWSAPTTSPPLRVDSAW